MEFLMNFKDFCLDILTVQTPSLQNYNLVLVLVVLVGHGLWVMSHQVSFFMSNQTKGTDFGTVDRQDGHKDPVKESKNSLKSRKTQLKIPEVVEVLKGPERSDRGCLKSPTKSRSGFSTKIGPRSPIRSGTLGILSREVYFSLTITVLRRHRRQTGVRVTDSGPIKILTLTFQKCDLKDFYFVNTFMS